MTGDTTVNTNGSTVRVPDFVTDRANDFRSAKEEYRQKLVIDMGLRTGILMLGVIIFQKVLKSHFRLVKTLIKSPLYYYIYPKILSVLCYIFYLSLAPVVTALGVGILTSTVLELRRKFQETKVST